MQRESQGIVECGRKTRKASTSRLMRLSTTATNPTITALSKNADVVEIYCHANSTTRRGRQALPFIKGIASAIISLLVVPSVAGPADPSNFVPTRQTETLQTETLRQRLESLRNVNPRSVALSFTGLKTAFAIHHSDTSLRLRDCSYDIDGDMSGLIDILHAAKITVGYPDGWEKYQPEARFGIYIGVDSPDGIDLWFSNPMRFTPLDQRVVGQSRDRGAVTAYKLTAAPTLRDELWDWVRAHGHPRKDTVAGCQLIEKYDPRRPQGTSIRHRPESWGIQVSKLGRCGATLRWHIIIKRIDPRRTSVADSHQPFRRSAHRSNVDLECRT
jgi:hypothetical protein